MCHKNCSCENYTLSRDGMVSSLTTQPSSESCVPAAAKAAQRTKIAELVSRGIVSAPCISLLRWEATKQWSHTEPSAYRQELQIRWVLCVCVCVFCVELSLYQTHNYKSAIKINCQDKILVAIYLSKYACTQIPKLEVKIFVLMYVFKMQGRDLILLFNWCF